MYLWLKNNKVHGMLVCLLCILFIAFSAVIFSETTEGWVRQYFGLIKKDEILKFIGISMGGVLLALQAVIANKRAVAMNNAARAQVRVTEHQAKANENIEKGQRQERLKNAIEHLGNDMVSVRLGGAYELFHLAQETENLRQTALDILCAHIRQTTSEPTYREKHKSKPSEEIQSLLTLSFVQNDEFHTFRGLHINLQCSWLNGVQLDYARLENADLLRIHLQDANLHGTKFRRANLSLAKLQCSRLRMADFRGADLFKGQLQATHLDCAMLQGAVLHHAELQGATLYNTELQGVSDSITLCQTFSKQIRRHIGLESNLLGITFSGGLTKKELNILVKELSDTLESHITEILEPHVDKPPSHELPKDSGAITGSYTEEEAEQWITEYEAATSGMPENDGDPLLAETQKR